MNQNLKKRMAKKEPGKHEQKSVNLKPDNRCLIWKFTPLLYIKKKK